VQLHDGYSYGAESKEDEIGRTCGTLGEQENSYWVLVKESEEKRPFWRPTRRWEDNINMDRKEIGCEGVD
jgi:hypothetical protein